MRRTFIGVSTLLAIAAAPAAGQGKQPPPAKPVPPPVHLTFRGRLVGVYDSFTGEPIEGVEVRDLLSGLSALTTRAGTLSLFFVDTAGGFIRVRKVGYEPQTMMVSNSPADSSALTLVLTPAGQQLPAVVTTDSMPHYRTGALRGFEERRHSGLGYFIPEATLQKESDRRMPDVIRGHIPGVNFVKGAGTAWYLVSARGESNKMDGTPCYPTVFLDGVALTVTEDIGRKPRTRVLGKDTVRTAGVTGIDLTQFSVTDYAGVEYYNAATIPPQYNVTGPGCGALLLWSRER